MVQGIVITFLICAGAFALTHQLALMANLYWYHWWFDIFMHLWGGALLALGVHALATFKRIKLRPTLPLVLLTLAIATGTWELFERWAGLYNPATYIFDTTKDVLIGFSGGLLAHWSLRRYTMS